MDCCIVNERKKKQCIRKSDRKLFSLPRRFSRKRCKNPKGFTMRSSCAPFRGCYVKKRIHKQKRKTIKKHN